MNMGPLVNDGDRFCQPVKAVLPALSELAEMRVTFHSKIPWCFQVADLDYQLLLQALSVAANSNNTIQS